MAKVVYSCGLFGMGEPRTLLRFPKGRVKIKMRPNDFVRIYIKTDDGIRGFTPKLEGNYWVPYVETGSNQRTNT